MRDLRLYLTELPPFPPTPAAARGNMESLLSPRPHILLRRTTGALRDCYTNCSLRGRSWSGLGLGATRYTSISLTVDRLIDSKSSFHPPTLGRDPGEVGHAGLLGLLGRLHQGSQQVGGKLSDISDEGFFPLDNLSSVFLEVSVSGSFSVETFVFRN